MFEFHGNLSKAKRQIFLQRGVRASLCEVGSFSVCARPESHHFAIAAENEEEDRKGMNYDDRRRGASFEAMQPQSV